MHQICFGLFPLGELTALPRLPGWLKRVLGLLLRGKGGKRRGKEEEERTEEEMGESIRKGG